ncbi:carboxyvinyl-carboxyphosphonate phosphorylmutase [Pusillimonas sp. TS35]|uniref:isocitrate lyase/PEP mutase family protein n=1 Tax=Paracandidimonas lactea TaxID=2895524 RepID=UPI001370E8B8|nr:isocitrate lyase/PEP mutase family protein [Paracandidimonas lactea]MYN11737.1 carboxyvinyl-carboxyphosphonate phosphorylmutase [Pusillimonas sp. TS35]
MDNQASKGQTLRRTLADDEFVIAPGVFDMFSALVADQLDFKALYMTGYGVSASHLGLPDAGLVTYSDMVGRAGTIARGICKPLIADADTGFGGLINVRHTVRGYEAAGVQAIQIEDQEMPKKCGHTAGRRVIPLPDMLRKIEVAVEARRSEETLIIARTDARTSLGLDEAIIRGKAFGKAGADIVFVESPETEEEFRRIGGEIPYWLLANIVPTGRSPEVPAETLRQWGFNVAIYPALGMSVATAALAQGYRHLSARGHTIDLPVPMYTMDQLHELVGFHEVWEFEQRHASAGQEG